MHEILVVWLSLFYDCHTVCQMSMCFPGGKEKKQFFSEFSHPLVSIIALPCCSLLMLHAYDDHGCMGNPECLS